MVDPDTLIEHERLRALLREGRGKGVTVAILDTGVDAEHPALQGAVRSSYEVVRRGRRLVCQPSTAGDQVSHGTACAGIIHKIAPEAELISVRVIGTNAVGTGDQLLHGLAWAIEQDVDVINLSLGTLQQRFNVALHELVDRAYFKGKILVAAANNHRLPSYPAHFASLIAVDNQSFPDPLTFQYQLGQPIETVAHGIYVNAPSPGGKYQCFTGTSFACPHITGLVARLRSVISGLTSFQLKTFLWSLRENRDDATSE